MYVDWMFLDSGATLWHRLEGSGDGNWNDWNAQFLGENGKGLLEVCHTTSLGASALWEDDEVVARLDDLAELLDGDVERRHVHDDDVVVLGKELFPTLLNMLRLGIEVAVSDGLGVEHTWHDESVDVALMVWCEDVCARLWEVFDA